MSVSRDEIEASIARDKRFADLVRSAVRQRLGQPVVGLASDITGAPSGAISFNRYKTEERSSLHEAERGLFFARVDVQRGSGRDSDEKTAVLITKAREGAFTYGDNWELISWTAPITAKLLDRDIDAIEPFGAVKYKIGPSAKIGRLLPEIKNATYLLPSGRFFLEDEQSLFESTFAEGICHPPVYQAQEQFALGEIIELADSPQRAALHLPFHEDILLDGPPGSGKTSIGIMRIPCLIDRQWDELGLDRKTSREFHLNSSMRVLVLDEGMLLYLESLVRSLGIDGVPVQTFHTFFQKLCRDAGTLSGSRVPESVPLSYLKAHPEALRAYWAGFKRNMYAVLFPKKQSAILNRIVTYGKHGSLLLDQLLEWANSLQAIDVRNGELPEIANFGQQCRLWMNCALTDTGAERRSGSSREENNHRETNLKAAIRELSKELFDWIAISQEMFQSPEYAYLLDVCKTVGLSDSEVAVGDKAWRDQLNNARPKYTDGDSILAAWLAAFVAVAPHSNTEDPGFVQADRISHILVDEAQDLSFAHLRVVRKLLVIGGTMTLVGDIHQRLKRASRATGWNDLGVTSIRNATFAVNYRQSRQLGQFVHALYGELFGDIPYWKPNDKREGPLTRVLLSSGDCIGRSVASEARFWRNQVPRATVGVIYSDEWTFDELQELRLEVESLLQDSLTDVYLATPETGSTVVRHTDCVIVVPTAATKGLEFDVVIYLEHELVTTGTASMDPTLRSNSIYVAVSRARQGLSIVMNARPDFLLEMEPAGLFTRVGTT